MLLVLYMEYKKWATEKRPDMEPLGYLAWYTLMSIMGVQATGD
jgi:hypothetical protein